MAFSCPLTCIWHCVCVCGCSCLPFDLEIEADEKLQRRRQADAARLIQMCVLSWRMGRNPPPSVGDSEEELAAWKSKVRQHCTHAEPATVSTRCEKPTRSQSASRHRPRQQG